LGDWCDNRASFFGPAEIIDSLLFAMSRVEAGGAMQAFFPVPIGLAGSARDAWVADNWGTDMVIVTKHDRVDSMELVVHFRSAYAPPIPFYDKLSALGVHVDAIFNLPGIFCGKYHDGAFDCCDYEGMSAEDAAPVISAEIDLEFGIIAELRSAENDE
jgi:hypothetical protein